MKINPTLKSILWIIVPLLLGGLGFYGLYRDTDWSELIHTLRTGVNYPILVFSLLFGLRASRPPDRYRRSATPSDQCYLHRPRLLHRQYGYPTLRRSMAVHRDGAP